MSLLVDTSVLIDLLRGRGTRQADALREYSQRQRLGLPDVVVAEVLLGARNDSHAASLLAAIRAYEIHEVGGVGNAVLAAAHYRQLRGLGITIRSTIDCLIASYCIASGHELLHSDRDYLPYEQHLGLRTPQLAS